jgi:hypothetical protein
MGHYFKRLKKAPAIKFEALTGVHTNKGKAVPVTGLEWPRGFQELKVHRVHDNGTGWW